jgi:tetratricopeptide (TPR) repeat protein
MRGKKALIAAGIMLSAALFVAAEVALDEVVQAGRFVLYRDHADAHKYYYVPDAPRLAMKRDGTPEFTFIKYAKTGGETKGGIIHFLVTWGMTEGELSSAESALRLKDPEAKIAGPVPFKEGTFKVVSATAGEGGIFSRRIVGEGKAPIMPGQKAAVSIALTEEGASLLWESFKNPTSDISVMFDLKFTGVSPAFQAKLKVNWDKVYTQHDIKLHAEGQIKVVKIEADVRAILEELRQKGAIELEVVGENENMQKMLDTVYAHLLSLMCEKVPMGPGEAASPPAKKRPVPAVVSELPGAHPAWAMGVLADVVRAADERLRGGPFWDQEQVQTQQAAAAPCDDQSRRSAESFARRAKTFINQRNFRDVEGLYLKAFRECPDPGYLYDLAEFYRVYTYDIPKSTEYFEKFLNDPNAFPRYQDRRSLAEKAIADAEAAAATFEEGVSLESQGRHAEAIEAFTSANTFWNHPASSMNVAVSYANWGAQTGNRDYYQRSIETLEEIAALASSSPEGVFPAGTLERAQNLLTENRELLASGQPLGGQAERRGAGQMETQSPARRNATTRQPLPGPAGEQVQAVSGGGKPPDALGGSQTGGTKPPGTVDTGTKPPAGQAQGGNIAGGQAQQGLSSGQTGKPPDTTGGAKPPSGQTPGAKPAAKTPAAKPSAQTPAIKPIVSVQVGYSFKRVKMSGNYQVDMRKRLREDRDIVMSGNIGGVYQKYGEDKRFFTVVSLDDPTFQERSVEVILDGQDASDFKNYINSVSVLFRKQRFSGAPMTGEVKFIDQQFAQSGNRLSFKYGRLNEASAEWLDYEYKPKWSFYGGVEWEGDWTKTSDSVLTLTPPVRRRTLEISVDEDNIIKNNVKALALQIKHQIYGKDILKEVIINYDKGDPLQAVYTYMHEDGNLGYGYKVVWLLLDGREVHTDWMTKESPFIYAVYTKK